MFKEVWKALWHSYLGKMGLGIFSLFVFASFYVLITYPSNFGDEEWNNPVHWADNPKSVPPVWTAWFDSSKAKHLVRQVDDPVESRSLSDGTLLARYEIPFSRSAGHPPSFISVSVGEIEFSGFAPSIDIYLKDGDEELFIASHRFSERVEGEGERVSRFMNEPFRIKVSSDERAKRQIERFFEGMHANGNSEFSLVVEAGMAEQDDSFGFVKAVVGGDVYGVLGTDTVGRNIWQGLVYGAPVALFIAITASLLVVFIGTILGGVSGYFGGAVDIVIQRFVDIVANVPLLPIMIFLIFVFGSRVEYVILIIGLVGWTGLAIQLRPLTSHIKTSGFVDVLQARGYTNSRILFRHVIPQTFPYILAQFILAIPSAILTEAGISFLGLGDASIPTWGQILQQGFNTGAQYLGYWWWIVPPGLAISLMTLAFYLMSTAIEHLTEPRMKGG